MFATLIVSHGGIANELLLAGRTITGELPGFAAITLAWEDDLETAREKIRRGLDRLDRRDGVLILVDMFGSTPCNAALSFLEPEQVEIVTGVNLPMVVRLGCLSGTTMPLGEAAAWLQLKGQGSICRPSTMRRLGDAEAGDPAACGQAPCEDATS